MGQIEFGLPLMVADSAKQSAVSNQSGAFDDGQCVGTGVQLQGESVEAAIE